jgi:hypothetical protein
MTHLRTFALLVLTALIVIPAGQSSAQVRYVDEQGNPHWVQGPDQVPERYRGKVTSPPLPKLRSGDVIGNERIREGPTAAEETAARVREHDASVQRRVQEMLSNQNGRAHTPLFVSPTGPEVSRQRRATDPMTFEEALAERERQLAIEKQAAAERRERLEIKRKEDREERRADESLRLQQQSVDLQRQELNRLHRWPYR